MDDATPHILKSPAELLATPVQFLKGVGPQRAELFARLGLHTARDVVFFFPRDYHDLSNLRDIADLEEGLPLSVRGEVVEIDGYTASSGSHVLGVLVRQGGQHLRAMWFNQPYQREKFELGQRLLLFGKPRLRGMRWEMTHPKIEILKDDEDAPKNAMQAIYPLTEGLLQHHVRNAVQSALEVCAGVLDEVFPESLLAQYELLPLTEALPKIHTPANPAELDQARRRFIFQELFVLQLALALRRYAQHELRRAPALPATAKIDARIRRLLPFPPTPDQEQAIAEIAADMASERPMNRLLQGEVGSGKTMVAVYAMLCCVAHGCQAALMAPTEVLARQHAHTLGRMLAASQVKIGLLTGGLGTRERAEMLAGIGSGEIELVVGTQAIIQNELAFAKLGLVVIDEQQKFGVRQRAVLKQGEQAPHYLVMTATPIPRTVTMTLFGDLDVSTIRHSPPGRQPAHTYLVDAEHLERWWEFVRKKLRDGRQAYVIAPLVEESENLEIDSAIGVFEELANGRLADFRLDLIHGRMTPDEKEAAMQRFREGATQLLVSTSVVEVGVDVPNATVMTIQGAERFGLAQLHQLRGRITRGKFAGYCGVVADPQTDDSRKRLEAFVATTDGFQLAEIDFELRGPGDLLGTRQHGLPPLRIADLQRDAEMLGEARTEAARLMEADPDLKLPDHAKLRKMVQVRYGAALELGDVG